MSSFILDRSCTSRYDTRMKKSSKPPKDPNQLAKFIVDKVTDKSPQKEKNPAAVALGRLGGLKGGKARADKLTPEQRKEIASKAAKSRWKKK